MAANELATYYIHVVPSMKGSQGTMQKEMDPAAAAAGQSAGTALGAGLAAKASKSLSKLVVPAALATTAIAATKSLFDLGTSFETLDNTIQRQTGASGAALDGLQQSARNLYTATTADLDTCGAAVISLSQKMGISGETLDTLATKIIKAGQMLGTELNVDTVAQAFNAWGVSGEEAAAQMDTLAAMCQATGADFNQMASSLSSNAQAAKNAGYSFEEYAGVLAMAEKYGDNASKSFMALSKYSASMAKEGKNGAEETQKLIQQLSALSKAGDTNGMMKLASDAGISTRQINSLMQAIQNGELDVTEFANACASSGDVIMQTMSDTGTIQGKLTTLAHSFEVAMAPLGQDLYNLAEQGIVVFRDACMALMPVLQWLVANFNWLAPTAIALFAAFKGYKVISMAAGAFNTLKGSIAGLGGGLSQAGQGLTKVSAGTKGLTASAGQILATGAAFLMLGAGVALAGVGLALLAQSAIALANTGAAAIAVCAGLVVVLFAIGVGAYFLAPALTGCVPGFLALGAAVLMCAAGLALLAAAITPIIEIIGNVLMALIAQLPAIISSTGAAITAVVTAIGTQITAIIEGIGTAVSAIVQGIGNGISAIVQGIANGIANIITAVGNTISNIVNAIGNAISGMLQGIASIVTSVADLGNTLPMFSEHGFTAAAAITAIGGSLAALAGGSFLNWMTGGGSGALYSLADACSLVSSNAPAAANAMWSLCGAFESVTSSTEGASQAITGALAGLPAVAQTAMAGMVGAISSTDFYGPANNKANDIKNAFNNLASELYGIGSNAGSSFVNGFNSAMHGIRTPHFTLRTATQQVGDQSVSYPAGVDVSWYAKGGIVTDTSLIGVGERGAEAILPLEGSYMRPFAQATAEEMGMNEVVEAIYKLRNALPRIIKESTPDTIEEMGAFTTEALRRLR